MTPIKRKFPRLVDVHYWSIYWPAQPRCPMSLNKFHKLSSSRGYHYNRLLLLFNNEEPIVQCPFRCSHDPLNSRFKYNPLSPPIFSYINDTICMCVDVCVCVCNRC